MKTTQLLLAFMLPLFANGQSIDSSYLRNDTTFTVLLNCDYPDCQDTVLLSSFDMGEIGNTIYLFFRSHGQVIALPTENYPALMLRFPEKNHQLKGGDFIRTERYQAILREGELEKQSK
jgi:hypothetical protein